MGCVSDWTPHLAHAPATPQCKEADMNEARSLAIEWLPDLAAGLDLSLATDKPVLLDFFKHG
mgnify:CR=1 FL=1